MKIMIGDTEAFKAVFKNIDVLADNINLVCNANEMKFNLLDRTRTTFMSCTFDKDFFMEYDMTDEEIYSVSASEFNKILKKCKGMTVIEFGEHVTITNDTKTFKLNLLDFEYNSVPELPTIPYSYKANVPAKFYKESLSDCLMFSEDIDIIAGGHELTFASDGMLGAYANTYPVEKELEAAKSRFAISKLQVMNPDKISDEVTVKGGNDIPVMVEAENPEGLRYTILVAPKIEE